MGIRQAAEIGTDLVANAQAAYAHFHGACIAIDFGTALTFTAIDAAGGIVGVSIAPGLRSAMRALFQNTAQLPDVPLVYPASAIGKDTEHAIQAGVLIGYMGLVKEILTQMKAELGGEVQTVATGGLVRVLPPIQKLVDHVDPFLTLDGLCLLAQLFESD
jgi:type III pantothenate kinase